MYCGNAQSRHALSSYGRLTKSALAPGRTHGESVRQALNRLRACSGQRRELSVTLSVHSEDQRRRCKKAGHGILSTRPYFAGTFLLPIIFGKSWRLPEQPRQTPSHCRRTDATRTKHRRLFACLLPGRTASSPSHDAVSAWKPPILQCIIRITA